MKLTSLRDYEIILDDLEFMFKKETLNDIKTLHNYGFSVAEISNKTKKDEYETLLAILHLHRQGKITRRLRVMK